MPRPKADAASATAGNADTLPLDLPTWKAVVAALELSPQQTRIVELLLRGMRDKQIAHELRLSVPTIRTYLGRIFLKLSVQDRVELILRVFALAQAIAAHHPDC